MKHLNQIVSDALTLKSTDSGLICKEQIGDAEISEDSSIIYLNHYS